MKINFTKTAVLTLDLQGGIFAFVPNSEVVIPQAARVVEAARKKDILVLHVGIGFEPGYPEISPNNARFSMLKERGTFVKGTDSCKVHPAVFKSGETMIYKHRVGAFSGNALQMILQAQGIENLVLLGIATSGIVLSTVRMASDLDFNCIVIKDACFDRDPEVHRVLTEKVFASQAQVITAQEFEALLID